MSSLLLTTLDTGNTAWMIMATILVLLMSIPGIALFYGGLVRQKNILSILMQTVFIVAVVSLIWVAFGYSWAFSTEYADSGNPLACVIGGFDKCFLHGIGLDAIMPTGIPELTFAMFQCMFALITPALILGAFAERVKFSGYVLFTILWVIIAYLPMAHWVWGGGFLQEMGAIDFAGGTVVHINAGVAALVMALCVGKLPRNPYRNSSGSHHLDAHRLDCQQEANHSRCLYRCCCRTGSHHSCSRQYRYFRSFLHRYHFHHRLLLHGSGSKGEVQV